MINIYEVDALVVGRRLELGVDLLHALHEAVALLLQLAARAVLARVEPLAVRRVDGLRRRRPASPPRHTRPHRPRVGRSGLDGSERPDTSNNRSPID